MSAAVEASYRVCETLARREAKSFYLSFRVLPPAKRRAMCAIYAVMRRTDDLADSDLSTDTKLAQIDAWGGTLADSFAGRVNSDPMLPAFHDAVTRFAVEPALFEHLLAGARMDLTQTRFATFGDLALYCFRVAGVVGLVCLRVWGCSDRADADRLGEACGLAFQLTNILRDVREDLQRGRIYLPQDLMRRAGVTEADLAGPALTQPAHALLEGIAARAEECYLQAAPLAHMVEADSRIGFVVMYSTYRALLHNIRRRGCDVLTRRVRVPTGAKLAIMARAMAETRFLGGARLHG
ncbi:MAG: phytoene/squalene synthase family protein [Armatimonadetes bacterium]|nr:phytoene/squalene synthase family protein [Armatimonadota bacterium]